MPDELRTVEGRRSTSALEGFGDGPHRGHATPPFFETFVRPAVTIRVRSFRRVIFASAFVTQSAWQTSYETTTS
jgi:hypothetical protein